MKYNKIKSFTLIEMLAVIIIIGILASVIFFSTNDAFEKQKKMEVLNFSIGLKNKNLDSLVSEWTFDGPTSAGSAATNNDVRDSWGYNHGDITGHAPTVREGEDCVSEKCLEFDASSTYIKTETSDQWKMQIYTFSCWIKANDFNAYRGILEIADESTRRGRLMTFGGDTIRFHPSFADSSEYLEYKNLEKDVYINLVAVWNGSRAEIYKNGDYVDGKDLAININYNNPFIYIGKDNYDTRIFNGLIDEVVIYKKDLSISEIKQNYIAGLDSLLENGAISKKEYNKRLLNLAKND